MEPNPIRRVIDPNISIFLDLTRFLLALAVAFGHWTQPASQDGWKMAVAAVGGFFILSGFTIRMVTSHKRFRLSQYCSDRLSRLWSVVLPALVITFVLDFLSHRINPQYYLDNWGMYTSNPLYRFVINTGFIAQLWNLDISPLSDRPFWSLSYEVWFYIVFGLCMARWWMPLSRSPRGRGNRERTQTRTTSPFQQVNSGQSEHQRTFGSGSSPPGRLLP
jgi:peptidoglycan/LPS O-acetylase OafA/YrhL